MYGARIAGLHLADLAGREADVPLAVYRYDPAGNLVGVVSASGRSPRLCYDDDRRLTGWRDRTGLWYRYGYDEQGRCAAMTGPGGAMSGRFSYGERVTWHTDAAGAVTTYQMDGAFRVTAVTDPLGHVTHLWYDACGHLTARADPLGRLTRYGYDGRGNLICVTRPGVVVLHPAGRRSRPVGRHPVAPRRRRDAAAAGRPVPRFRDRPALPAALLRSPDGQLSGPRSAGGRSRPGNYPGGGPEYRYDRRHIFSGNAATKSSV